MKRMMVGVGGNEQRKVMKELEKRKVMEGRKKVEEDGGDGKEKQRMEEGMVEAVVMEVAKVKEGYRERVATYVANLRAPRVTVNAKSAHSIRIDGYCNDMSFASLTSGQEETLCFCSPKKTHFAIAMVECENRRKDVLLLAYQSFGVIFADLAISPLYVYRVAFSGKLRHHQSEEVLFGAFSLIFWTLTLFSLLKYAVFMLSTDDNGEGGIFAVYSLLCRQAKFSLLPNYQAADEEISTYQNPQNCLTRTTPRSKRSTELLKKRKTVLLLLVLFSASMVVSSAVLTPAISGNKYTIFKLS
ncbi:hypothetical protein CRG98_022717 [Punica granatum]|uniref:K+ potassium transporter integral membrane domain-containing protein n=1 Tax=Punica granatum TaxID=22663 RepID=A0A2I0JKU5_PUNGR|nr:hypothetical protein CRG98_022717 [Punica granatum]